MNGQNKTLITLFLLVFSFNLSAKTEQKAVSCDADPSWFDGSVTMPVEVKKSNPDGGSNFCDFYQFSWQAFLYLMSPSASDSTLLNFQDTTNYPILEFNADGSPANSCDSQLAAKQFRTGLDKSVTLPESINQAGDGATIYDQNGNVVYYDVRFSRNMCDTAAIDQLNNFPAGTTEIKTAWRVLQAGETSDYVSIVADIGSQKGMTLGLIGFHLAVATADHPEFVWATFEQDNNTPACDAPSRATGWSFASSECSNALINKDPLAIVQCQFNQAEKQPAGNITGTPTQICQEYPNGTKAGDPNSGENVADITALNQQVKANVTGPLAVLKNYFNVGGLWVNDTTVSSSIDNQRGSLRLANTVAETTFQNIDLNPKGFISNCFGCHAYEGTSDQKNKNTSSGSLSHIFDDITAGQNQCLDVQAGPIANNADAQSKCPSVCSNASSNLGKWNGQWKTTVAGSMSVCGCCAGQ